MTKAPLMKSLLRQTDVFHRMTKNFPGYPLGSGAYEMLCYGSVPVSKPPALQGDRVPFRPCQGVDGHEGSRSIFERLRVAVRRSSKVGPPRDPLAMRGVCCRTGLGSPLHGEVRSFFSTRFIVYAGAAAEATR
jgi:hypothetical protein